MKRCILASASPRRSEILRNLGVTFEILAADVDETCAITDPTLLCEELAARKGDAIVDRLLADGENLTDTLVIASDTVVAIGQKILGKPRDEADARSMLSRLSGQTHHVVSGIYLWMNGIRAISHDVTAVTFDAIPDEEIERYIASGEPFGKAGAYAIQGHAAPWISGIRGDYFNVVGLPVHRLHTLFRDTFPEHRLF